MVALEIGARALPSSRRPAASFSSTHASMSGSSAPSVSGSVSLQTNIMYLIATVSFGFAFTTVTIGGRRIGQRDRGAR